MDRRSVKRRWRSILRQSMLLLLVVVIMAAIVLAALWCWTKWLTPPGQVDTLLAIGVLNNVAQGVFGSARRCSSNWFVQFGSLVAFYPSVSKYKMF
jgi:hypothetical protein